jgi:hypothetical protein
VSHAVYLSPRAPQFTSAHVRASTANTPQRSHARVRPQPIRRRAIPRPSQITHQPHPRPLVTQPKRHSASRCDTWQSQHSHIPLHYCSTPETTPTLKQRTRVSTRHRHNLHTRTLDIPPRKAKLVPALQHARLVIQAVVRGGIRLLDADAETAVRGRNLACRAGGHVSVVDTPAWGSLRTWIIPLHVLRGAVPEVDGLPKGVVAWVKGAAVNIKLV